MSWGGKMEGLVVVVGMVGVGMLKCPDGGSCGGDHGGMLL